MPLDSATYVATKTEPTLDDLIAWLETRDPSETYDFMSLDDCVLARAEFGCVTPASGTWQAYVAGGAGEESIWTMSEALSRARAWRASHAV